MEIWKEVPGLRSRYGKYEASSEGRVRNGKGKILLLRPHHKGYHCVRVVKDGRETNFQAHRAVALAHILNPENKPQVNHKNGIKTDNRVENLEWCTNTENHRHAQAMGLRAGILTKDQVLEIRNTALSLNGRGGTTRRMLCDKFNVSMHVVKDVRARRSYVEYE